MGITNQNLVSTLKSICSNLNEYESEYLIIGGTAVNFHGYQRISGGLPAGINFDIDIWYNPNTQNFINIVEGIKRIGVENAERLDNVIFDPVRTFLRLTHDRYRMEFLPHIKGFEQREFAKCHENRSNFELEGVIVPVIAYEDLRLNKLSLSRDVDKIDLIELEKIHSK